MIRDGSARFRALRSAAASLFCFLLSAGAASAQAPTLPAMQVISPHANPSAAPNDWRNAASPSPGPRDPLVKELARSLGYDIDLIFAHVHDHVELTPTFGLQKGARGVALDSRGNAFDQAQFMVDALREADQVMNRGYNPKYVFGQITLTTAQFAAWFGVSEPGAIAAVLADGGIPGTVGGGQVTLSHVWVQATIGGTTYVFDPSYKQHTTIAAGIPDLAAAMGYNGAALLSAAVGGATQNDGGTINAFNKPAFQAQLTAFRTSLEGELTDPDNNLVGAKIDAVVGGRTILGGGATPVRLASLAYATGTSVTWDGQIPEPFRTSFTVMMSGWSASAKFYADEVYAKPLRFSRSGNVYAGVNGVNIAPHIQGPAGLYGGSGDCSTYQASGVDDPQTITVTVNHPYPAAASATEPAETYGDRTIVKRLSWKQCSGGEVLLTNHWGEVSGAALSLLRQGVEPLPKWWFRPAPMAEGAAAQYSSYLELAAQATGSVFQLHDLIGLHQVDLISTELSSSVGFGSSNSYTTDALLVMDFQGSVSVNPLGAPDSVRRTALGHVAVAGLGIAESAVSRQEADVERDATSLTLLTGQQELATTPSDTYYLATSGNWASVASNLQGYSEDAKALIQGYVSGGQAVLLPKQGALRQKAYAYSRSSNAVRTSRLVELAGSSVEFRRSALMVVDAASGGGGVLIYDPRRHGFAKGGTNVVIRDPSQAVLKRVEPPVAAKTDIIRAGVSIDPKSGSAGFRSAVDLSDGVGEFPAALTLERRYDPDDATDYGLGVGWRHNWYQAVTLSNDGFAAFGSRGGVGAASALVAIQTILDLATSTAQPLPARLLAQANTSHWLAGQTLNNVATVSTGLEADQTFLRAGSGSAFINANPDGSTLVQTGAPKDSLLNRRLYHDVGFNYVGRDGDVRTYEYTLPDDFVEDLWEPGTISSLSRKTLNMTTWRMPTGLTVYTQYGLDIFEAPRTNLPIEVRNGLGSYIKLVKDDEGNFGGGETPCYPGDPFNVPPHDAYVTYRNSAGAQAKYNKTPYFNATYECIWDETEGYSTSTAATVHERYRSWLQSFEGPDVQAWKYHYDPVATVSYGDPDYPQLRLTKLYRPSSPTAPAGALTLGLNGRTRSYTTAAGSVWQHFTSPFRYQVSAPVVDEASAAEVTEYDAYGRPVREVDGRGNVTTTAYDGRDRVARKVKPELNATEMTYDLRGNLLTSCDVPKERAGQACSQSTANLKTVYEYQEGDTAVACAQPATCNKVKKHTDPRGGVTDYQWGPNGELALALQPADRTGVRPKTVYAYASHTEAPLSEYFESISPSVSLLQSKEEWITATTTILTTFSYDPADFTLAQMIVDAAPGGLNLTTTYDFDAVGNPSRIDGPRDGTADARDFLWDSSRRLTHAIDATGDCGVATCRAATRFRYDIDGAVDLVERGLAANLTPAGFSPLERTKFEYDVAGRIARETRYDGVSATRLTVTDTAYDARDRVSCVATRMNMQSVSADPFDGCAFLAPGVDRLVKTTYDGADNVVQLERGYGAMPSDERVIERYAYSPNGLRTDLQDPNGHVSHFVYDGFDRLSRLHYPLEDREATTWDENNFEEYGYDRNGNRERLRRRDGREITYVYDSLNRQIEKHLQGEAANDVYSDYDLLGRLLAARFTSHSGPGVTRSYDKTGRLLTETTFGTTVTSTYGDKANRTVLDIGGFSVAYDYDPAGRMRCIREAGQATCPGSLVAFTYDSLGRRSALTRGNGASAAYQYDGAGRLRDLSQAPPPAAGAAMIQTISYNPAGQIETLVQANDNYVWKDRPRPSDLVHDGLNRIQPIAAVTGGYDDNGNLTDDGVRVFTYDLENRLRTLRPAANTSGPSLNLDYDPLGRLSKTTAAPGTAGEVATVFLYDGQNLVAEYSGATALPLRRYIHGPGVDEPLVWYEGSTKHWLHADRQGSIVADTTTDGVSTYTYGPYGEPSEWGGRRFRYTGQIALHEAQLYHYKARVYDPGLGRFLQTDSIGYSDGPNLYAYVQNDPINGTDPTGNDTCTADSNGTRTCVPDDHTFRDRMAAAGAAAGAIVGGVAGGAAGGTGGAVAGAACGPAAVACSPAGAAAGGTAGAVAGAAGGAVAGGVVGGLIGNVIDTGIAMMGSGGDSGDSGGSGRNGEEVTRHAQQRMGERSVTPDRIEEARQIGRIKPGNTPDTVVREVPSATSASGRGVRVVLDRATGRVVTVIDKGSRFK